MKKNSARSSKSAGEYKKKRDEKLQQWTLYLKTTSTPNFSFFPHSGLQRERITYSEDERILSETSKVQRHSRPVSPSLEIKLVE